MGTVAASCVLLIALALQGGAGVPVGAHCRLHNFQEPYITNYTFMLAKEVLFSILLVLFSTWELSSS